MVAHYLSSNNLSVFPFFPLTLLNLLSNLEGGLAMNPELFNTQTSATSRGTAAPATDTVNEAGGAAYALSNTGALAQYVCTGTLNKTFYATAKTQLEKVVELCEGVDPVFIAQCAVYAREKGHMKDMPALLLAILSIKDTALFAATFPRVITNGKMLRNFAQVIRSGAVGRKSFGHRPKREMQKWLQSKTPRQLLIASIGNNPSLGDIIKMVRPKPVAVGGFPKEAQEAMFAHLIGKPFDIEALPVGVSQEYIRSCDGNGPVTDGMLQSLPHRLLTKHDLSEDEWRVIAMNSGWTALRMNLNSFAKHGVFSGPIGEFAAKELATMLRDPESVRRSRCFPYQLLTAFQNVNDDVPTVIKSALQDAMEVAIENVPTITGNMAVLVDTSGSMGSPVTGYREGSTTTTRCVDVAALVASAFLRKNQDGCTVVPFDTQVHQARLNPRDSVMSNAQTLANFGGGGTDISCALRHLNDEGHEGRLVVIVSDNESWFNNERYSYYNSGTTTAQEWERYKSRNPEARLVCVDIAPYGSTQVPTGEDVLNVGGFSDSVFDVIATFAGESAHQDHWVHMIEDHSQAN